MSGEEQLRQFITRSKQDPVISQELADCAVEKWGDAHLPLDIDLNKVIQLADRYGYRFDRSDVIRSQCQHLQEFALFEMNNAFVARRFLARIQCTVEPASTRWAAIDYYRS